MKYTGVDQILDYIDRVYQDADRKLQTDLLVRDIDPDEIDVALCWGREQREGWRERTRQQFVDMLADLHES